MSSTLHSEKGWLTIGVAIRVGTGLKCRSWWVEKAGKGGLN